MLKKIGLLGLSLMSLSSLAFAAQGPKKLSETFQYDAANGWWWYKEKYEDKDKKTFEVKTKMTTKEKMQKESSDEKIKLMKEQNAKLDKIKERLEYAFPNITPVYTKNSKTGKKCLTNSKVECFVFPLQAEAQHVPVMAKWLSNPNPENSKEWLKWQAKYFNHLTNIGYGNKFAYLTGGSKVYNTDNLYNDGDSLNLSKSSNWLRNREYKIISQLDKKVTFLLFLGKTKSLDKLMKAYEIYNLWNRKGLKDLNFYFVFPSQKDIEIMEGFVKLSTNSNRKAYKEMKEKGLFVVKPKYFKRFNIETTPSAVTTYMKDPKKGENGKNFIWQRTVTGSIQPASVIKGGVQFLIYNKIVEPKELSTNESIRDIQKDIELDKVKTNEKDIYKSTQQLKLK